MVVWNDVEQSWNELQDVQVENLVPVGSVGVPPILARSAHKGPKYPKNGKNLTLKGSFTIFLFFVRTHILDSNEVWYS